HLYEYTSLSPTVLAHSGMRPMTLREPSAWAATTRASMPPPSSTEVADRQFADSSDSPPLPPQPLSAVRAPRVMAAVSSLACFFIVVLPFRTFALTPVRPGRRLRSLLSVGVFRATTTIGKPPPFAKSDN